jgi:hypothetical protein
MADTDLLVKMMEQLRDDFREEREASRQSRQTLHNRMDEVAEDVGTIRGDIRILGQVDGQIRSEVQGLSTRVDNAQPTLEEWRRIRAIGIGLVGLLALGGVSVGAALAWAGEGVVHAIRQWLRIG